MPLPTPDRELLLLWSQAWRYPGIRDQRVLEATGLHPTQAAQRVNMLIDTQAALEALPVEVNRLRRIRAQGQRSRRVEA
ncbi:DUF3263 domain-containing protein [Aeromicrobium sp. Leaf291]|uniref:DUF3263 domain-containing protein n=1 Tax=Aeromicrobium sp. Leaf291 TaxID=1736325 RepID=UPI0006F8B14A|nr:DUF3263 domain-containing protein [Aeromicrobium sp. Leaf291]KQP83723.1 hypothetical protein ASF35_01730 [Aeromicrobium sp. Leaf291]